MNVNCNFLTIIRSGDILYSKAAGRQNFEADSPPFTEDSVCWIASMTKLVTAIAAMQVVEKGLITLDDDVGSVVPELSNLEIIQGFNSDGTPNTIKATKAMTLRYTCSPHPPLCPN